MNQGIRRVEFLASESLQYLEALVNDRIVNGWEFRGLIYEPPNPHSEPGWESSSYVAIMQRSEAGPSVEVSNAESI